MKKMLFAMLALSGTVFAQEAVVEVAESGIPQMTIKDIVTRGGGIMYVIVAMSVLALVLIVYYLLTLRFDLICPEKLVSECQDAAAAGNIDAVKEACLANPCPAASIIGAAVENLVPGKAVDAAEVRELMEDEGARQANAIWQKLQYLMDIAVISPMVGLLGTVWGMMVSFSGLESGVSFVNKADALASGVSQAMFTTFGGLIVGIMSMAFYAIMRGRLNRIIDAMETSCNAVLRALIK